MSFSSLGLSADLLRAVTEQGYDTPTPIQTQAIPVILASRDLMATAQTGTGKTAAFMLPLLQRLGAATGSQTRVRALVLTPTRELAQQVADSVRSYGKYARMRCAEVYGGVNINPQMKALRSGPDVVVATPGRLIDHLQRRTVDLSAVEVLVLDEADRMLDMGFMPAIERIIKMLPRTRQTLLFSATFSDPIRGLAQRFLNSPQVIDIARRNATAEDVTQSAYLVDTGRKRELLAHLFETHSWQQVLVFTRTKHGADRLALQLSKEGIESTAIHGNKSQNARNRALADFKRMKVRALIATDVAARGIDIEELPHVINFDVPHNPEDYVHRIGRTGRGGQKGAAISLVSAEERGSFNAIKRLVQNDITTTTVAGFEPQQRSASAAPARQQRPGRSAQAPRHRNGGSDRNGSAGRSAGSERNGNSRGAAERHGNSAKPQARADSHQQRTAKHSSRDRSDAAPARHDSRRSRSGATGNGNRNGNGGGRSSRERAFLG
jgi:ATP-dependent RNA helicase RhlE